MSVSLEEVRRIASLARLSIDDEEAGRLSNELSKILDFAVSIQKLDTSGIPPTTHVLDIVNVWRDDAVGPGEALDRETILAAAPAAEEGCFIAPKIV